MYMKQFNIQSAIKLDNAGCDGEPFGIASAVISVQMLIIVWYMEFSEKKTVSQKVSSTLKSLHQPLKMLRIVPLHCGSSLPVVCRSKFGWKICKL